MASAPARPTTVGEPFRAPAAPLPPWLPTRKRNRLPLEAYREPGTFFVTIGTERRRRWFSDARVVQECVDLLFAASRSYGFNVLAYCFMPEHLHLLANSEGGSDLVRYIHTFKQKSGYWFRNRNVAGALKGSPTPVSHQATLWQKSYRDHILRKDEDVADVVRYIVENPVRSGLADVIGEYPHVWSVFGNDVL